MTPTTPADSHVHSEFSWDAVSGDMEQTCRRAVDLGLPALAFTEHADFTPWVSAARAEELRRVGGGLPHGIRPLGRHATDGALDVPGYWASIDRCRALFPGLWIRSGVELGEAHRFLAESANVLARRPMDLVLGSVHCIPFEGTLVDMSAHGFVDVEHCQDRMRTYLTETLSLVERSTIFAVLTHLDYPKRYWPHDRVPYDEREYEEEFRAVLHALARSGRALEVNTSRGADPRRGLCPGPQVLRWWHEVGGQALSFGSDTHDPDHLLAGFDIATDAATQAGFRPAADPSALWLR